ncbi:hypothetical protein LQ327_24860 [Actinomycetospora endophytica]|uniref:Excreted virulence factor EspC (Type VII ESX diderm) n=1 Tax=Actinomycetospora endophytica TaxID=2291215 RepID=A0ABS8PEE2_9PSEU|nr:hypothetical protein [Actinomycetospora endophytica]MCD2196608.1 hypothetical protein [Actinomycetospora endophytica]
MADGIDADLAEMAACAQVLRTTGDTVGQLGADAGQASAAAGGGVIAGPLTASLDRFTAELQARTQRLGAAVVTTGSRVSVASGNYATSDAAASRRISGAVPTTGQ